MQGSLFDFFDEPAIQVGVVDSEVIPRPYQDEAVCAIFEAWEENPSTLLVLPTGTGKSVCFSEVMRRWMEGRAGNQRAMLIAHRQELIYQGVQHAERAGLSVGIEMGSRRTFDEDVVVSTVQTQIAPMKCLTCMGDKCARCHETGRQRRFQQFNPHEFGLLIIDEAHHCPAKSYRTMSAWYQQNPNLRMLGVTATPKRHDSIGMHNVFDSVAYEMEIKKAIEEGWLCPIRQRFVTCDWLDLSEVGTKAGGDLADGELEKVFLDDIPEDEQRKLHEIVKPCLEEAKGQPILAFTAGVVSAEKLTMAFNAYDDVQAEMVVGTTDKQERMEIIKRYQRGDTQVLVGCGVFLEGFDAPGTAVVAIARPTNSELLFTQMIGRGTRPLPGVVDGPVTAKDRRAAIEESGKKTCLILDFVGNSGKHKLVSVADVLAGKDVKPVDLDAALATARKSQEPVDIEELIAKAKQAREEKEERLKREREERCKATSRRAESADYAAHDVDLFDVNTFDAFADYDPEPWGASQKQVNFLVKLGVNPNEATTYSRGQANQAITELKSRRGGEFRVAFGKHSGKALKDVPGSYLNYMLRENNGFPDFLEAIREMRGERTLGPTGDPF